MISFTLGAQAMVSGYLFYVVLAPWPPLPSAVASVALGAITSLALWIVVFEPIFRREGAMPTVIASFAVSVVMQETVRILASADVRAAPSPFGESILRIRGVAITAHTLARSRWPESSWPRSVSRSAVAARCWSKRSSKIA